MDKTASLPVVVILPTGRGRVGVIATMEGFKAERVGVFSSFFLATGECVGEVATDT